MPQTITHSPTLESVLMVEETIRKYSQEFGKYQLWKKLPRKMMYQTFQAILEYLENAGKILIDIDGIIIWTYDLAGIKKTVDVKTRVIRTLEPYLKDVVSASIFGSYARKEQTKESDVDVLLITNDKIPSIEVKGMDIISITLENLRNSIEKHPEMFYQIIQESEPLINSSTIEELKKIKLCKENFSDFLKDTRAYIKTNVEFLELDKLDGGYVESHSVLYSTMLRLRGVFILKCILQKNAFSNKNFKSWVIEQGVSESEFEGSFRAYRLVRDKRLIGNLKIRIDTAEKLIKILKRHIASLETHDK